MIISKLFFTEALSL